MKRILTVSIMLIFISGCEITPRQPLDGTAIAARTPIVTAESTINPSDTEAAPSPSATETSATILLFNDNFDSAMQPGWEWQNEKNENWSLLTVPGSLQINAEGGFVNLNNISNLLLRPAPQGNFQVETTLLFHPRGSNQFAGLILYESDKNFIQAGYSYCTPVYGCVGSGLYMDVYQNGALQLPRNPMKFENDKISLRLIRQENTISFLVSEDGAVWFRANTYTSNLDVTKIGIVTGQNTNDAVVPAIFEYFQVTSLN